VKVARLRLGRACGVTARLEADQRRRRASVVLYL